MSILISPWGNTQFFTVGGEPANGYKLHTYKTQSTDELRTYTSIDGDTNHTNPIVLNEHGLPPVPIYIDSTESYRFVLAMPIDETPPTMPLYVVDDVEVPKATTTITPEWILGPTPTYISPTQFRVPGNMTAEFHTGRRVKFQTGSFEDVGTVESSSFNGTNTTVTISIDIGAMDGSLLQVWYGFLSALQSSWPGGRSFNGIDIAFAGDVNINPNAILNIFGPGSIILFAGLITPPFGYLACNGGAHDRILRSNLFNAIGTIHGAGNGSTTFNVPNIPNLATTTVSIPYFIKY